MSAFWLNIRVWRFHLQMESGSWRPKLSYNDYWAKWIIPSPFIEVCDLDWSRSPLRLGE